MRTPAAQFAAVVLSVALALGVVAPVGIVRAADGAAALAKGQEGKNLVSNPAFTKGKDGLDGWQSRFPEPNETKYGDNHNLVKVVDAPGRAGVKAARLDSTPEAAPSQGVKLSSEMIPIDGNGAYRFGLDLYRAQSTDVFVFLETYRADPDRTEAGADAYPGYVRVGRVDAHPTEIGSTTWGTTRRDMYFGKLNKRYRPTHVLIKIYAYYPAGQIYATNVYLRQINPEDVTAATGKRIVEGKDGKKYKVDENGNESDKRVDHSAVKEKKD